MDDNTQAAVPSLPAASSATGDDTSAPNDRHDTTNQHPEMNEHETLNSDNVIELQAFSDRKVWIEDKIKVPEPNHLPWYEELTRMFIVDSGIKASIRSFCWFGTTFSWNGASGWSSNTRRAQGMVHGT